MGWFQKLVYGVDLDAEQRRQNELDAQLAAANREKLDSGDWSQKTYDIASQQLNESYIDVNAQVDQAFSQGASDGATAIRTTVGGTINNVVAGTFAVVPWQIWLIGLGWAFFSFGGPKWLAKVARSR
jgi:hypothetical protein